VRATSTNLKTMVRAVRFDRQPFDRTVRWRTIANVLSMGFVVRKCFQCSAGEVVESQQHIAILAETFGYR
jgi:hypothetical protein